MNKMEKQSIVKGKTVKQVRKLNLSGLGLREIPSYVFQYTNLTKLVLSRNAIKKIPQDISRLRKLKVLDLSYNDIEFLPAPIFKLPKLQVLAVGHNRIRKFPVQLKGCSVEVLIADHNLLKEIPNNSLDNLSRLIISNNPLEGEIITHKFDKLRYYDFRGTRLSIPPKEFFAEDCKGWPSNVSGTQVKRFVIDDTNVCPDLKSEKTGSIFISHSSKDKDVIEQFVDQILKLGIGIPNDSIFCTSIEGMGIENGAKMREWIHEHIKDCDLAFLMISPNYKNSEICLNEMGAIWALGKKEKILLLPGVDYDNMGWLEEIRQAGHIEKESTLDQLYDELTEHYGLKNKASEWGRQKKKFLGFCKGLSSTPTTSGDSTEKEKTDKIYLQCCNKVFDMLWYKKFSGWTEMLTCGTIPKIPTALLDNFDVLVQYLDSRAIYAGYDRFDALFRALSLLISDFLDVFDLYADGKEDICVIRTFYRENPHNPNYHEDLEDYKAYVDFIKNMTFEITRLCNSIITEARGLMVDYKPDFGIFAIDSIHHLRNVIVRLEYEEGEIYNGLKDFWEKAITRQFHREYSKERVARVLGEILDVK